MRIAVISPHFSNNGATTLSLLIGFTLADTGKLTCVTHTETIGESFYEYLNFIGYQDKTSTPSQIVKILREGELSKDDVRDYCKQVGDDLEAFTNNAKNFSQTDMNFMIEYIAEQFPHEHVVFDVNDNDLENNKETIKLCDVVVLNITQSVNELKQFVNNKDVYMDLIGDKPLIVVVNKYNSIKGTLKKTANWMGIKKPNNWIVLHENPWIPWATNHGELRMLFRRIKLKDDRVIELHSDLEKIKSTLMRAKAFKDKAKQKKGGRK